MAATSALVGVIESAYHHPAWTSSQVPEPGAIQGGPNPELKLQVDQAAGAAQFLIGANPGWVDSDGLRRLPYRIRLLQLGERRQYTCPPASLL